MNPLCSLCLRVVLFAGGGSPRLLPESHLATSDTPSRGGWDLTHEIVAHQTASTGNPSALTPIPLAYGVFCAAYDWGIAGYIYVRRQQWRT
jgi:hypothetical protein